jgi:hypothetical protein
VEGCESASTLLFVYLTSDCVFGVRCFRPAGAFLKEVVARLRPLAGIFFTSLVHLATALCPREGLWGSVSWAGPTTVVPGRQGSWQYPW